MLSVIIPANNEADYIKECLTGILETEMSPDLPAGEPPVQVIVVANGCTDNTVSEARSLTASFQDKGWLFEVLDLKEGSKIGAINAGDAAARYAKRAYIDADIRVSPALIMALDHVLERPEAAFASGQIKIAPAKSWLSRRYAAFWLQLPFIRKSVPGCGVFAVNEAGRARWGAFPDVISDDTFVRHHFAESEMHGVPASFEWPITEGFVNLVRVRRRQDIGLHEIRTLYPDLASRMADTAPDGREKLRLFFADPIGFVIYAAVALTVRTPLFANRSRWDRGR